MIELAGVRKRYGQVVALDGCTLTARPGRLTGFVGPNGAGKTTTMRVVLGLVSPDAGEVRWQGRAVTPEDRARFGYMPEERGLYSKMRVGEQLAYFGRLAGLTRTAARAGASRWLEALGLSERARDRLDMLSHGNQQRAQLACALVADPQLLVLDEPFAGLDPIAMDAMAQLLRDAAARGATVLFSSHQLDLVQDLCEDVVIVNRGRVVLAGPLEELRAASSRRFVELTIDGQAPRQVEVPPTVDLAALVGEAQRRGPLVRLEYAPPTLSQLFRAAVDG